MRPGLIDSTVTFEQDYFLQKVATGRSRAKLDLGYAHRWYKRGLSLPDAFPRDRATVAQSSSWTFMKLFVNMTLMPRTSEAIPPTFTFDEERILKLRQDMQDVINLEVCMHLYQKLKATSKASEARLNLLEDTPRTSGSTSFVSSPADDGLNFGATLPSELDFTSKRKHDQRGHFTQSASGHVWIPVVEDDVMDDSASSTPRSSPSSTASTPETAMATPLYLNQHSESATQVRTSLQAILASSSFSDKWSALSPNLALQILRATPTPLTRLPEFESHLAFHISNPRSRYYLEAEARILSYLLPLLQTIFHTYSGWSAWQVYKASTRPKVLGGGVAGLPTMSGPGDIKKELSEIATRMAHIGILHWRVWSPIAYLVDPEATEAYGEDEDAMRVDSDMTSST